MRGSQENSMDAAHLVLILPKVTALLNHSQLNKDLTTTEPASTGQRLRNLHPTDWPSGAVKTNSTGQSRFPGAGTQPMLQSWHNQGSEPQVGTSLPDLSADLSTAGFSQSSLLPRLIFCPQAYFFPLIPNPTRWPAFMRLTLNLF